ncbi:hypothetical protein [Roseobacter sp. N2S]|uniref:hypothetical protein n=1 Tax=Roseobacter sp. N2S TaxID=2663844 RepID=UPI002865E7F8|nr:hypothetical protein [Roseobacter sp. N2S]MDR6265540.1 MFS family permease [Roseobacter sp. N2S]
MFRDTLNRPFYSYVVTQSALVLIVLAASYLLTFLVFENFGIVIDRFLVSLALIVAAQLPVAAIYARSETQEITSNQGWALAFVFVGVTLAGEAALQLLSGHLFASIDTFSGLAQSAQVDTLVTGVCGILAAVLLLASASKIVFRLAVNCHLRQQAKAEQVVSELHRPKISQDFSEFFRRELIGANIGIFGLSLAVFGPDFMMILKLSLPLSIVFSVICVANRLARSETRASLSARSLHISIQLMPLTVTCLILLGLGELYSNYLATTAASASPMEYAAVASAQLAHNSAVLSEIAVVLGLIFALTLATNTLMLVLFTRLIRPLVRRAVPATTPAPRTARPAAARRTAMERLAETPVATPEQSGFIKASDIVAELKARGTQTARPSPMLLATT